MEVSVSDCVDLLEVQSKHFFSLPGIPFLYPVMHVGFFTGHGRPRRADGVGTGCAKLHPQPDTQSLVSRSQRVSIPTILIQLPFPVFCVSQSSDFLPSIVSGFGNVFSPAYA